MTNEDRLWQNIKNKKPLCFTRFNDGELTIMTGDKRLTKKPVSRGHQKYSRTLQEKLNKAWKYRHKNYWIGHHCPICYPQFNFMMSEISDCKNTVLATMFCNNRKWKKTIKELSMLELPTYWVVSEEYDVNNTPYPFSTERVYEVPDYNSWEKYDELKDEWKNIPKNSLVLLSCGPLSRILSYEWFKNKPESIYLDIGSVFDKPCKDVVRSFADDSLPYCPECNNYGIKKCEIIWG